MTVLRRVKRAAVLASVIAVSVVAGTFLASWRALGAAARPASSPDAGSSSASDAGRGRGDGGRTVDVRETERGQPATRNYVE